MIKTLQRKYIITAMIAVSVLLLVLLGGINAANIVSRTRENEALLSFLAMQEGMGPAPQLGDLPQRRGGMFREPPDENARMSALYFVVRLDENGQVLDVDLRRTASVDRSQAESLALRALAESKGYGRLEGFRYQLVETARDCVSCVFLDLSRDRRELIDVGILSALGGALAWAAMLALVWALSRRAIRPIAENMERQRQFVTDAGHELKTPLAIILANTEAMELSAGESKYSRNIRSQVDRLSQLTQNLLTLARLDESSVLTDVEELPLSQLCREALEMFRPGAEGKQIRLEANIQPELRCTGSRQQMNRLLSILLDNAVKYCPPGGHIAMSLSREESLLLCLRNTAPEPRADLSRIFDRFYRSDAARSQKSGGYGIGLSAAQAIVRLHKGELSAAYEGEDVVFTVKL